MGMARQNERSANNALSDLLRGMMHGCEVRSESTRTISEQSGSQPDILITAADRAPVVIEAEYMPAAEVEEDAAKRLGLEAANTGARLRRSSRCAIRMVWSSRIHWRTRLPARGCHTAC